MDQKELLEILSIVIRPTHVLKNDLGGTEAMIWVDGDRKLNILCEVIYYTTREKGCIINEGPLQNLEQIKELFRWVLHWN